MDVGVGRHLLGVRALQEVRDAARELDHLQPARHLAERVGHDLAVLGADDPREVVLALLGDLTEREHDSGATPERGVAPVLERGPRRLHGGIDVPGAS